MTRTINADELLEWLETYRLDNIDNEEYDCIEQCIWCFLNQITKQLEQQEKEDGTHR